MPLSSYGYEGRCRVELQIISAHGAYHLNFFRRTARVSNVYIKKIAVHTSPFPRQSHNSREHFHILTLSPHLSPQTSPLGPSSGRADEQQQQKWENRGQRMHLKDTWRAHISFLKIAVIYGATEEIRSWSSFEERSVTTSCLFSL